MKSIPRSLACWSLILLILPAATPATVNAAVNPGHVQYKGPRKLVLSPHVTAMGGAVFDKEGNLLVGDADADVVYKFDPNGKMLARVGGHGKGEGQFQFWNDNHTANGGYVALDAQGNIFVADTGNHRVQKFSNKGKFLRQWGKRGEGDGELHEPYAISTDAQGNVYVTDMQTMRVQKFDNNGKFIAVIAKPAPDNTHMSAWLAHTLDRAGNLYVADFEGKLFKFNASGKPAAGWGDKIKGIKAGYHLITDSAGNLYVSDATPRVFKIDPNGKTLGTFEMPAPQPSETAAVSTAIDAKGQLYIGFNSWNGKVWDTSMFIYQPGDLKPMP